MQFFLQLADSTLGRCKIGKYMFPSQCANMFLTYQTFVKSRNALQVARKTAPCDRALSKYRNKMINHIDKLFEDNKCRCIIIFSLIIILLLQFINHKFRDMELSIFYLSIHTTYYHIEKRQLIYLIIELASIVKECKLKH